MLSSCNQAEHNKIIVDEQVVLDTLFITEDMRGQYGFNLKFDSLTSNKHIPRNVWVDVHVKGRDTMVYFLKHADLYLNSKDSNFRIQRLSKFDYKFYINNDYRGYIPNGGPVKGQVCLEIYSSIQPNNGYVLSTYWLDNPITYPEMTHIQLLYETLEEVN